MDERHRPTYHFLPPGDWMNDPNGLIQFNGEYHLFYQHNPLWPAGGNVLWGHAVSDDLVHWRHLPHALYPDRPYDAGGCWSGCAVNDGGTPVLIYTGVMPEVQCIAFGSPDMRSFTEYEGNPVIPSPPEGLEVAGFRDPCVWKEGGIWRMVIGSGIKDKGGAILLYESADLRHWEYVGIPLVGDMAETGEMWECPNLISFGDKWALFVSVLGRSIYFVGDFDGGRFTPTYRGETDLGGSLYAPQVFRDERGRWIMLGWLWERRTGEAQAAAGWAGVQSLPRVVSLSDRGTLSFSPAEEVELLRGKHVRMGEWENGRMGERGNGGMGAHLPVPPFSHSSLSLEILAQLAPADTGVCAIKVLASPDGREKTVVAYDFAERTLTIDTTRSSISDSAVKEIKSAPVEGGTATLRIFVDRSVVEAFANGTCLTARVYPELPESTAIGVSSISSLDVWDMDGIW